MRRSILTFLCCLVAISLFAQYDAECFNSRKQEIKADIKNLKADSVFVKDSIYINGVKSYGDTLVRIFVGDVNPQVQKIIGCRMPDFNFFTINKEEMSIDKITTDFTLLSFLYISCGDVCNARIHQFSKLKSNLKDSITVINIYDAVDNRVVEYAKDYESNVEFVANADVLSYNYSLNTGTIIFLLDKYKNIIYVKSGQSYHNTPDEIYPELLEKIRSTNCSD